MQHLPLFQVAHHRDELALLKRLLVDAQKDRLLGRPPRQAPIHRPLHDAVGLAPRQSQTPGRGGASGFLHPVDGQAFQEDREMAARLGPGNPHLFDAMFGARTTRHVGFQQRLELAGVQVPPASRLRVIARTDTPALRALQAGPRPSPQAHDHPAARQVQVDIRNDPGFGQPKDLRVQVPVAHGHSTPERKRILPGYRPSGIDPQEI